MIVDIQKCYFGHMESKCITAHWLWEDTPSTGEYTNRIYKEVYKKTELKRMKPIYYKYL